MTGDDAHYVGRVLRGRPGDVLIIVNGDGFDYHGRITRIDKKSVALEIHSRQPGIAPSPCRITLMQAMSRNEKMDWVLQKSVELGVTAVRPVVCERSVMRLDDQRLEKRHQHWQGVVFGAIRQSGRADKPELLSPLSLADAVTHCEEPGLKLIALPTASQSLNAIIQTVTPPVHVHVLIGPEGGFSDEEAAIATTAGFEAVSAGPRIMRTETAALAFISALQYALGDWQ